VPSVTTSAPARVSAAATVAAALLLAAASLLVTGTLRFDPLGWLRWGREVGLGEGAFDTSGLPSWKPLPLLASVPLAFTGAAAPWLWLWLVRSAGLAALALVYRLTARRIDPVAGATAAVLLALAPGWWPTLLGGGIEPVVVALGCGVVVAYQAGRHGVAFGLLTAMALGREEAALLLVAYGAVLCRADRRWLAPAALAVVVVAGAWLGGDWLGSGNALHGGELARAAAGPVRIGTAVAALAIAGAPPLLALWAAGAAAAWRGGDRCVLALAGAGLAWAAADVALALAGYPVPPRFLLPAAAASAVVAGAGVSAFRHRSA
jgi:hypothetical protein